MLLCIKKEKREIWTHDNGFSQHDTNKTQNSIRRKRQLTRPETIVQPNLCTASLLNMRAQTCNNNMQPISKTKLIGAPRLYHELSFGAVSGVVGCVTYTERKRERERERGQEQKRSYNYLCVCIRWPMGHLQTAKTVHLLAPHTNMHTQQIHMNTYKLTCTPMRLRRALLIKTSEPGTPDTTHIYTRTHPYTPLKPPRPLVF